MLNFCDFIQVYVFTTNHHFNLHGYHLKFCDRGRAEGTNLCSSIQVSSDMNQDSLTALHRHFSAASLINTT